MENTSVLIGTILFLLFLGFIEYFYHRRSVSRLRIRIHVNGTRGKSSVTRLIAAGLRAGGIKTCAKTTGTLARMILPDGTEYPVFRPSRPNVIEQLRIVRKAASIGAEALVVECMALLPNLQSLSERKLLQATHGVITNARADHLDVMGPEEEDVALALAGIIPPGKVSYTSEHKHLPLLNRAAKDRNCRLVHVDEAEVAQVGDESLSGFAYVEHAENVALALRVCHDLGVDQATALRGMWEAVPDPGAMNTCEINFFGRRFYFVNGFAANDPESTETVWNIAWNRFSQVDKRVAIFNCRADRPDRSKQLGKACVNWNRADHYLLMGTGTYIFARAASANGLDSRKIYFAEGYRVDEIFEAVVDLCGRSTLVLGVGNIGGDGLELVQYFRNRSILEGVA